MLKSLFRRSVDTTPSRPSAGGRPARVPPGVCVYAVGDIHGRADLLAELHRLIVEDASHLTPGTDKLVVYVGDFVDRGMDSRGVIDLLIEQPLPEFSSVHLLGNHDAWLMSFLIDPQIGPTWLRYGGDATLHSYGVPVGLERDQGGRYRKLQASLRERVPRSHVDFLQNLELSYETGDFLFAHAGVKPTLPLDQQTAEDLLWIREPFLSWRHDLERVVVHGHTVTATPEVRNNRIGIDTGACWTGSLTCLVLEEGSHRFLSTARQPTETSTQSAEEAMQRNGSSGR